MLRITVTDGIAAFSRHMARTLNAKGITQVAVRANNRLAKLAADEARKQLIKDLPHYARWADLIEFRAGSGTSGKSASVVISRRNRRIAALLALHVTGERSPAVTRDIRGYLVRVNRSYTAQQIFRLMQFAHGGTLESSSNTPNMKVYVSPAINDEHFALVIKPGGPMLLFRRWGRPYRTVYAPSTGGSRGERNSELIAYFPPTIQFRKRYRIVDAVDRSNRRNRQLVFDSVVADLTKQKRFRAVRR